VLRVARVANRSPCPSVVRASHGISSYSYSAPAVLVLVLEDTASSTSTSTISLSTSTIKAKTAQLQNATADGARARWDASTRPSESLRNSPQRRQVRQVLQVNERPATSSHGFVLAVFRARAPSATALKLRYPHVSEFQSMFSLAFRTRTPRQQYSYSYSKIRHRVRVRVPFH
jgi:hypothetical protein